MRDHSENTVSNLVPDITDWNPEPWVSSPVCRLNSCYLGGQKKQTTNNLQLTPTSVVYRSHQKQMQIFENTHNQSRPRWISTAKAPGNQDLQYWTAKETKDHKEPAVRTDCRDWLTLTQLGNTTYAMTKETKASLGTCSRGAKTWKQDQAGVRKVEH